MLGDRHGHLVSRRGDFQRAIFRSDGVVVGLRVLVQRVGERVVDLTNIGDGAGHIVGRTLACGKAVAGHGHVAVRQRRAVVDLLGAARSQRHGALCDGQLAVRRHGDDVLLRPVNGADGAFSERRIVLARIRALRADGDRGEIRTLGRAGEAGDALLFAVVGLGLAVRGQLYVLVIVEVDHVFVGGDGQSLRSSINNCEAVDTDGPFGYFFAECLVGDRLAGRNRLSRAVPVVVDGVCEVAALCIGNGFHNVVRGHRAGNSRLVDGVAVNCGGSNAIRRTERYLRTVIILSRAALGVHIVDGESENVLLIVDLDDVLALIRADRQREILSLVQNIAARALVRISADLRIVIGLVTHSQRIILHAVDVVLDRVRILIDLPDRVQIVVAVVVHAGVSACREFDAAVARRAPAHEAVARARRQASRRIILHRDLAVIGNIAVGFRRVRVEIAVICQRNRLRLIAPDGIEHHIAASHADLVARMILGGRGRLRRAPAEEHLAGGRSQAGCRLHVGMRVLAVLCRIGHSSRAAVGIIGHGILVAVAHLGEQIIVLVDLGVKVEGCAFRAADHPAEEGFAFLQASGRGNILVRVNRPALGHCHRRYRAVSVMESHRVGRRLPLSVQRDVLRGHGLAVKIKRRAFAQFIVIPAVKSIILQIGRHSGRVGSI